MLFARYFLMVLVAGIFAVDIQQAVAQQMVSVSRDDVNLRSGPGTRYSADWVL